MVDTENLNSVSQQNLILKNLCIFDKYLFNVIYYNVIMIIQFDEFKDRIQRLHTSIVIAEISEYRCNPIKYRANFCKYKIPWNRRFCLFLVRSIRDAAPPVSNKIPFLSIRSNLLCPFKRYSDARSGASRLTSG